MQQYRVNYTLLIGLVVGTLICTGAVYALWRFQIERKSGWLIQEAQQAIESQDYAEAARYYQQYLTIQSDDNEARIEYARAYANLSQQSDVSPEDFFMARQVLESVVRNDEIAQMPESEDLQRQLVQLYGQDNVQRYKDALDHLSYMLERNPDDGELKVLRAKYLMQSGSYDDALKYSYELVGYDPQSDSFDVEKAAAPHDAQTYFNLAIILRTKKDNNELAERVIDQLIDVNPKSAEAYLARGKYYEGIGESGREYIEKAHELDPENADVLLAIASMAAKEEEFDRAGEYLTKGKELHPEDPRFYQAAADTYIKQQEFEKALAEIDEGLKKIKGQKASVLLIFKADLLFHNNDIKGVKQTMEDMTRAGFRSEFIDWYAARVLLAENKWFEANKALNRLRPKVASGFGNLLQDVDNYLGLSYEKLGRPEQALEQYMLVLEQNPENAPALAGRQRMEKLLGRESGEAADPFQERLAAELAKPPEEQDWKALQEMLKELAEKREWDDTTKKLVAAQMLLSRKDFDGAAKALSEANQLSPNNLQIHRMMVQLTRENPDAGPEQALKFWEKVNAKFGDSPELRVDKADILIALHADQQNKDELRSELAGLSTGIDEWEVSQKVALWSGLATRYISLGMSDEARQFLSLAADSQPNNLPLRLSLFSMALDANDDEGMKAAQDKILEIVGSKNDSDWIYTEARRRLSLVSRGQLGPEALDEIRLLVNRALQQRPDAHALHLVKAELELRAGKPELALAHYDRAEKLGRPYPAAVATHIRLLAAAGRIDDAGKLLDRIPESARQTLLGQLYAEILFRTDQVDSAIKEARQAAEADPENAQKRYWHSQLLARSAQDPDLDSQRRSAIMKRAVAEMEKALELQPEFPDAWFSLIQYHGMAGNADEAEAALRNAQLALSGDNLQIFLAKSYEALGRWFDAEAMYRALYEAAPDEVPRARQLAAFYLGPAYRQPDQQIKATPLINQVLHAGADEKISASDPNLLWARRMAAKMMAASGDYQSLRKAENLLASNSQDGSLTIEDKLEMASILASRPEPLSRLKAINLLEDVSKIQPLSEQAGITLGELYYKVGRDWRTYTSQMEKVIGLFPESAAARRAYVNRLLIQGDQRSLNKAADHVERLQEIAGQNLSTFGLAVRLADKMGREEQARNQLRRMMPDFSKVEELQPAQAQMLLTLASLLVEVDDLDNAEKVYQELAARDPNQIPALAAFLGTHRDVEQSFAKLNEIYSTERIPILLQVGIAVIRQQRDKVGDKFDAELQRWLDAGLRENPGSINLLIMQADLYDLQRQYDKAADVYRELLARDELKDRRRAVVLNNLAFLLALEGESTDSKDPLKLIQEAAQILGPTADILDTRAMVYVARKQYKEAIQDLELAVTDNPSASTYFHKALAHLLAGQNRAAVEAWEKAEELGLTRDSLNRMEHERYEEIKRRIEQIRGASVTQAEPRRRAG